MNYYRRCIKEFVNKFDQKIYPHFSQVPDHVLDLRANLIEEEFKEYRNAQSRLEELDALVDLIYVTVGTLVIASVGDEKIDGHCSSLDVAIDAIVDELYCPVPCAKRLSHYVHECVRHIEQIADMHEHDLTGAFDCVHTNNMDKLWDHLPTIAESKGLALTAKPKGDKFLVTREDGKIVKPFNHPAPDLSSFL